VAGERKFEVRGAWHAEIRSTANGHSAGVYRSGDQLRGYAQFSGSFVSFNGPDMVEAAAFGVNVAGAVAGAYRDHLGHTHGFLWRDGKRTVIDGPGAIDTAALGISASGEVVGAYRSGDCRVHGLRWMAGQVTSVDVDLPGATGAILTGIDDDGNVAGQYSLGTEWKCEAFPLSGGFGAYGRAFAIRGGSVSALEALGDGESIALGFDDSGETVGQYRDASGTIKGFTTSRRRISVSELDGERTPLLGTKLNWLAPIGDQLRR
jgi:uncharacterized membrane protein